jgi:predicted alpha/beta-fold hydrolase
LNKETNEKRCKFYGYGCSLGAGILLCQLENEGKDTFYDGASVYCTPWDVMKGHRFFYDHANGFYSWAIGLNLNRIWRAQLPKMRKYMDED